MSKQITANDIRSYASKAQKDGRILKTRARGKPFTVAVRGKDLYITPGSTEKERLHEAATIDRICEHFNKHESFTASEYRHLTWNASYTLSMIHSILND